MSDGSTMTLNLVSECPCMLICQPSLEVKTGQPSLSQKNSLANLFRTGWPLLFRNIKLHPLHNALKLDTVILHLWLPLL